MVELNMCEADVFCEVRMHCNCVQVISRKPYAQDRNCWHRSKGLSAFIQRKNWCRQLEAADELRRRKSAWAAQRRAEDAKQKATVLESRIARGARVRRARELRNERNAARRAAERDAAVESAKRCYYKLKRLTLHTR